MNFIDLVNVVTECDDALPCPSMFCDIVIDSGDDHYKIINHVELRLTADCKHAVLVFCNDDV